MTKIIKGVKVNDEQLAILLQHKDRQFALKKEVHADIFPALMEGLRQIRELTQNIAIIAGAIAAFTIPVINTDFVQVKILAYLALVLQFITIIYVINHLTQVITKEVNELAKQHSTYVGLLDQEIDRTNEVIESGDISKFVHTDEEVKELLGKLDNIKANLVPDKSLDRLRLLLTASLVALCLSFISTETYSYIWQMFSQFFVILTSNLPKPTQTPFFRQ